MSLISTDNNLFILDINYLVDNIEVDKLIDEHLNYLEKNYAAGYFIASGAKVPRTGGVIIATVKSLTFLNELIAADPFVQNELAEYRITEFHASRRLF